MLIRKINFQIYKRQRFTRRFVPFNSDETDNEIKFIHLIRTIEGLDDNLKLQLKVFLCINPKYIIPEDIDLEQILTMIRISRIIVVTPETTAINPEDINVLGCPFSNVDANLQVDETELYVTPREIREQGVPAWLRRVVFYSFALEIGDRFCFGNRLTSIGYRGMTSLLKIGNDWMSQCHTLVSPNFNGLSALTTVGNFWIAYCHRLVSPNFNGLSALTTVRDFWMYSCHTLVSPNFNGLSALTTVGDFWMYSCHTLVSPNFNGLSALTTVGDFWMAICRILVSPNFLGLSALTTVGNFWMEQCVSLNNDAIDFRNNFRNNHDGTRSAQQKRSSKRSSKKRSSKQRSSKKRSSKKRSSKKSSKKRSSKKRSVKKKF